MGPSGFQTKGLEYRGVVGASLFFSLLALCLDRCFTGTFPFCQWKNSRCFSCSVEYSYWISYSFLARYF